MNGVTIVDVKRAKGCLLGGAVGDALGSTRDGNETWQAPIYPSRMYGPTSKPEGGGRYQLTPGQGMAATQTAVALWSTLRQHQSNSYDPKVVADAYAVWGTFSFDINPQTTNALREYVKTKRWSDCGWYVWEKGAFKSAPNSSLTRTYPIGVYFSDNEKELIRASVLDSAITNFDPKCMIACAVYNLAIARLIMDEQRSLSVIKVVEACRVDVDRVSTFIREEFHVSDTSKRSLIDADVANANVDIHEDIDAAHLANPKLYGEPTTGSAALDYPGSININKDKGFVRIAFRMALWQLVHAQSYKDAIIDVANRGSTSAANSSVTGALLGAYYGLEGIPDDWKETVIGADYTKSHGVSAAVPIWNTKYHAKLFL